MSVPSSNLLKSALRLIAASTFQWHPQPTRTLNQVGQFVNNYSQPVKIKGSVQAVPRRLYEQMGLEFQKTYVNFYVPNNVVDVQRDVSGDTITYKCQTYQCLSNTQWFNIDGWNAILAVRIA